VIGGVLWQRKMLNSLLLAIITWLNRMK
jgi:hypothetical protein